MKEFLESNNVDLTQFKLFRKTQAPNARRKLKRLVDKVTIPTQQTAMKLKRDMLDKINKGNILKT